jgi:predicted amidohydrolase YtcJ
MVAPGNAVRLLPYVFLLVPCACASEADLILYHGKVVTVDKTFSVQQAVAIKSGRIAAVGLDSGILGSQKGPATKLIDLHGRMVLPGLFDSHVHPLGAALSEFRQPLPALNSFGAIQQYIRGQAAHTPKGEWIVVPRTFPTRLNELRMPDRHVLDVDTDHPVMFDVSYVVVVNSLGLKVSGITRDTPNPPRGEIVHDSQGEPNGILRNAQGLLKGLNSQAGFSEKEKLQALEDMLRRYVDAGITSIGDGAVQDEEISLYRQLKAQNRLPLRVTMTWWHDASKPLEVLKKEIQSADFTTGTGDDWLRFGAFKINIDGGMTIGTAYQRYPYGIFGRQLYGLTNPDDRGQLFESPDKLLAIMRTARDRKWQLSAHCQGGGAIDGFLQALETLDREKPIRDSRSHLIHASFQSPEAIARMKKIGILADVQPAWLELDSAGLTKVFGRDGMRHFFPLRSYISSGILPAGGSDHMVGHGKDTSVNPYNPFRGMWTAVTRLNSVNETVVPEEKITRQEALKMYTIWAAYRHFAENQRGSIEAGKLADLVVIDRDYLTCPEDEIRKIEPLMVLVDGRVRELSKI